MGRAMIASAEVGVSVKDAKASARWWKEKLGFKAHVPGGSGHAVLVAPPGDRFTLHLYEGFERVEPGNTGIAFVATDVMKMVRETTAMRAPGGKPPTRARKARPKAKKSRKKGSKARSR